MDNLSVILESHIKCYKTIPNVHQLWWRSFDLYHLRYQITNFINFQTKLLEDFCATLSILLCISVAMSVCRVKLTLRTQLFFSNLLYSFPCRLCYFFPGRYILIYFSTKFGMWETNKWTCHLHVFRISTNLNIFRLSTNLDIFLFALFYN